LIHNCDAWGATSDVAWPGGHGSYDRVLSVAIPRFEIHDPGFAALRSAVRAAIVIPAVFAFADKVIGNPQTSFLAAFGSFAMLVLTEFTGTARNRFLAYLGLGCIGAVYITLGTLCSRTPWLGALVMAAVGFVTLFAGAFNGYFAAGATGAILTFVLPVTIPAPNSAIPDRLAGWGLAVGAGICAVMLLWPARRSTDLQRESARTLRRVADVVDADPAQVDDRAQEAHEAVKALGRRLLGAQHRPTGPVSATAALASLPDELDWLLSFVAPSDGRSALDLACVEDGEAIAAIASALRTSAARLEGSGELPDLERLDRSKLAVARALIQRLPELPDSTNGSVPEALDAPFRIRVAVYSTRQVADDVLIATGARPPAPARETLEATERSVLEHVNVGDIWFRNSVRGALALAVAVFIAERTGLQHAFWVVLGTLSVLRSNALSTGWSVLSALAGTAVGLVVGALLVIAIGTHEGVLWAVLPFAVLLGAYAPRAISFAAGQAGFTVTLFVLFNLIQPVGWSIGLVRIEDVAIGFAISLGVGLLFWPRGAAALLRTDLGDAYGLAVDHVVATARTVLDGAADGDAARTERAATAAEHRLDDAFRQYLNERSATAYSVEDIAALISGVSRLLRSAQSLEQLESMMKSTERLDHCGANLDRELDALQSWYVSLGHAIENRRQPPPPHLRDDEGRRNLIACVQGSVRGRDKEALHAALMLLWTSQHIDNLWRLESHLRDRAAIARADAATTA
jgi:uncharacterized membrane protein YccC